MINVCFVILMHMDCRFLYYNKQVWRAQINQEREKQHIGKKVVIEADYDTFFQSSDSNDINDGGTQLHGTNPMPKNYLHFVYGYTVCCGDR